MSIVPRGINNIEDFLELLEAIDSMDTGDRKSNFNNALIENYRNGEGLYSSARRS